MKHRWIDRAAGALLLSVALVSPAQKPPVTAGPVELRVDNLPSPLGIDDPAPKFSWQLQDPARGATQTAYVVQVASTAGRLETDHADVWTSGRIESSQSLNVPYAGPALNPSTRYFWHVKVWGANGKSYPASKPASWETGLMAGSEGATAQETGAPWHAQWIGYETPEEATVRHALAEWIASPDAKTTAIEGPGQHFDYRATITLAQPVRFAALYATAEDTVSAWINGIQVLTENPRTPYGQLPWKKFLRAEATSNLKAGENTIAIEALHYVDNHADLTNAAPSMISTLVVQYQDGSWASFASDERWRVAGNAPGGWHEKNFDDSDWKSAIGARPKSHLGENFDPLGHPWPPDSVKALRHEFDVSAPVKSARLYATALGAYEMFLNGKRVGDQVLAPGWTDYREWVVYQTYDVASLLAAGKNTIGALLAPGWYSTPLRWDQQPNNYGATPPALRAQLRIEHADGSVEWVATDASWQANTSDILDAQIYDGETEDDRAALKTMGSFVHSSIADAWPHVSVIDPTPVKIVAQDFPPIRVERELQPKSLTQPRPGVFVYDFGQNFSGVESVRMSGPAGTNVKLRLAEVLNADGTIYTENLRTAKVTDHFILNGKGVDNFTPQFTFHGFRYAELTGLPTAPDKNTLTANVFHTDAPFTAKLSTGSAMLNQLWSNILWGQRSNFVGLPTDCPQRDERLGWMGDAEVFWRAASYNTDLAAFSRKFAADMRGTQVGSPYYGIYSPGVAKPNEGNAAGWSDAGVIIPWTSWLQTGDTSIIQQNWDAMQKYLDALQNANPDFLWKNDLGDAFGDWLSPEGKTDQVLIGTAYWAYDVTLMRQMAHATGRAQDEERYAQLFDKIRAAFQKQFVHDDGFVAGADNAPSRFGVINNPNAMSKGGDTQTGYVLALHMNLVPDTLRAVAARKLADKIEANHDLLGTGFLGTPYLLEELTKAGYAKLAYTLLLNTQYPSWGYMVEHGATTMWERWNGDQMRGDPSMNSYNHYAYGAVADWIYRFAAGIDATSSDPGFHTVVLHPVFDARLGHLAFDYDSQYGAIHSDWTVTKSAAKWTVTIPANTAGWLPLSANDALKYKLNGIPLSGNPLVKAETREGQSGFLLAPGGYTFEIQLEDVANTSVS